MNRFVITVLVIGIMSGCAGATPTASPAPSPAPTATAAPSATTAPTGGPRTTFIAPAGHDRALGMTVTLPVAGWRYDDIALGFAKGDEVNGLPEAIVLLWSFPAGTEFWVYGDPCQWSSTRPGTPAITAADIVALLAAQASRDASEPADVTIGGYLGKSITLHVPNDAVFDGCDSGSFASYGVTGDEPTRYHQGPGQSDEFWVVDVDGAIAVIDAMYRTDTPAELVAEMRAIAESITFEAP
jgi:hypothetical protein